MLDLICHNPNANPNPNINRSILKIPDMQTGDFPLTKLPFCVFLIEGNRLTRNSVGHQACCITEATSEALRAGDTTLLTTASISNAHGYSAMDMDLYKTIKKSDLFHKCLYHEGK